MPRPRENAAASSLASGAARGNKPEFVSEAQPAHERLALRWLIALLHSVARRHEAHALHHRQVGRGRGPATPPFGRGGRRLLARVGRIDVARVLVCFETEALHDNGRTLLAMYFSKDTAETLKPRRSRSSGSSSVDVRPPRWRVAHRAARVSASAAPIADALAPLALRDALARGKSDSGTGRVGWVCL